MIVYSSPSVRAVIAATMVTVSPALAQVSTWDGSASNLWLTAANWSSDTVPSSGVTGALFDSSSTANLTISVVATNPTPTATANGITVTDPAGNIGLTIDGTGPLSFSGGITLSGSRNLTVTRGAGGTGTAFFNPTGTQTWNINSGRTLAIVSNAGSGLQNIEYDIDAAGAIVTMIGGGSVDITAANFDISQSSGRSSTVNVGNGSTGVTLTTSGNIRIGLNATPSPANGTLTINNGAVNVNGFVQLGSGVSNANLTMNGGTLSLSDIRTVANSGGTKTLVFDGGTLIPTVSTATFIANASGATSILPKLGTSGLTVDSSGFDVTIAVIMGDLTSNGVLIKDGDGVLTLSRVNTYTGSTSVNQGTLALTSAGSIASTSLNVASGAIFDVSAKTSYDLSGRTLTFGAGAATNGLLNAGAGELLFNGGAVVINLGAATPAASYDLLSFGSHTGTLSSVSVIGTFVGSLSNPGSTDLWTASFGGYNWSFDETSGILSTAAIPEPAAYAALAGLGVLGIAAWRRRRS